MLNKPPRGRRSGGSASREDVLDAARRQFLADGYRAVSMRSIAGEAGVDVALVSYYFGSKHALFGAVMQLSANPAEVIQQALRGGRRGVAERLLTALLETWDDPARGRPLRAVVGAVGQEAAITRLLREVFERELIQPLAELFGGGADAVRRAGIVAAQLSGVVFSRYLLELEPIASLPAAEVVELMAPALQRVLEPPRTRAPARR